MFGNIEEIQKNLQSKLEEFIVEEEVADGKVKITANAAKKIMNVRIDPSFLEGGDHEELEDLLLVAFNRVMQKADEKAAEATQSMMSDLLPPGMDLGGLMG
ncbi:MAG: YbaB/EbfC family nucleoid-associated protein [Bacteroidota bacterium]